MDKEDRNYIMSKLEQHQKEVFAEHPYLEDRFFLIAANGSMNYNCWNKDISDVDSHMLVFPSRENILFNTTPFSSTLNVSNDEKSTVKDVREYLRIFAKANINFMEFLKTDYYICNPDYEDTYMLMRRDSDILCDINRSRTLQSALGMAIQARKTYDKTYSLKEIAQIYRLGKFIKYFADDDYYFGDCLTLTDADGNFVINLKRNIYDALYPVEHYQNVADRILDNMKRIVNNYVTKHKDYENKKAFDLYNAYFYNLMDMYISNLYF